MVVGRCVLLEFQWKVFIPDNHVTGSRTVEGSNAKTPIAPGYVVSRTVVDLLPTLADLCAGRHVGLMAAGPTVAQDAPQDACPTSRPKHTDV